MFADCFDNRSNVQKIPEGESLPYTQWKDKPRCRRHEHPIPLKGCRNAGSEDRKCWAKVTVPNQRARVALNSEHDRGASNVSIGVEASSHTAQPFGNSSVALA